MRLVDETFQGSWARYTADTRAGARIVVLVPSDARPDRTAFDREVWLSSSPDHAYLLTSTEEPEETEERAAE